MTGDVRGWVGVSGVRASGKTARVLSLLHEAVYDLLSAKPPPPLSPSPTRPEGGMAAGPGQGQGPGPGPGPGQGQGQGQGAARGKAFVWVDFAGVRTPGTLFPFPALCLLFPSPCSLSAFDLTTSFFISSLLALPLFATQVGSDTEVAARITHQLALPLPPSPGRADFSTALRGYLTALPEGSVVVFDNVDRWG